MAEGDRDQSPGIWGFMLVFYGILFGAAVILHQLLHFVDFSEPPGQ